MQRKFLFNLAFLVFLNLLVKPFWIFGIDREVQNQVGAEAYGTYFALFNLALILNIFLDLGTSNFNNRNVSQHEHLLDKYFPRIVALRMVLAVAYAIICAVVALVAGYSAEQLYLLAWLCFNQFLLSFVLFLRSNIAGLQLYRTDSFISVLDRLLLIALCAWLLWFRGSGESFHIEWFIYAQTVSYVITAIVALGVIVRRKVRLRGSWNGAMLALIMKQSLPFALLILLMSIYGRIDSVLIERLLPDGDLQAGIYAQAFRLLDASNMIAYLFAVLLLPMFSRMLKLNDDVRPLASLATKLLLLPAMTLAIICATHGNDIMHLLYTDHVDEAGTVLSLLMFSLVPMAGSYIFGTLLTANGKLKHLNIIASVGVAMSLVVNFMLIPQLGALGAAWACLLTQGFTFVLQLAIAFRMFRFKWTQVILTIMLPLGLIVVAAQFTASADWMLNSAYLMAVGASLTLLSLAGDVPQLKKLLDSNRSRQ